MKKKPIECRRYLVPQSEVVWVEDESSLLVVCEIRPTPGAGNPPIQVGDNENDEEEIEFE